MLAEACKLQHIKPLHEVIFLKQLYWATFCSATKCQNATLDSPLTHDTVACGYFAFLFIILWLVQLWGGGCSSYWEGLTQPSTQHLKTLLSFSLSLATC